MPRLKKSSYLKKITFVLTENRANADEIRKKYFSKAFPLAQAAGMKEIATFKTTMIMGSGNPDGPTYTFSQVMKPQTQHAMILPISKTTNPCALKHGTNSKQSILMSSKNEWKSPLIKQRCIQWHLFG
jgi:hypothetical protein